MSAVFLVTYTNTCKETLLKLHTQYMFLISVFNRQQVHEKQKVTM